MSKVRHDSTLPVIAGMSVHPKRLDRRTNKVDHSRTVFVLGRDGKPHARGYRYTRNEFRKIVPRRYTNVSTPQGRLKQRAYTLDVTRAQMAAALRVGKSTLDTYLAEKSPKLKPWMVHALSSLLCLTKEDIAKIHDAGVRHLGWEKCE